MKIHGLFWALVMMTAMLAMSGCGAKLNSELGTDPESRCRATQTCKVGLAWDYDPQDQATLTGFKVHYGRTSKDTPGFVAYDNVQLVPAASLEALVSGLGGDDTLYFAVTAYREMEGTVYESIYSNEISVSFVNAPEVQTIHLK